MRWRSWGFGRGSRSRSEADWGYLGARAHIIRKLWNVFKYANTCLKIIRQTKQKHKGAKGQELQQSGVRKRKKSRGGIVDGLLQQGDPHTGYRMFFEQEGSNPTGGWLVLHMPQAVVAGKFMARNRNMHLFRIP